LDQVELDEEKKSIHFQNDKVINRFRRIWKRLCIGKIKSILEKIIVRKCVYSFGESSIFAKGKRPDGNEWSLE
jgi:hypothetical protein